jgi:hypothetical protein
MRQDFILDFETIGQGAHQCPIVDCAYVAFSWDRFLEQPYSFDELTSLVKTDKFDVKTQYDAGRTFSKADLAWWEKQGEEAKSKLKPQPNDLTIEQFSDNIFAYLIEVGKIDYWWSRGNSFDPVLLDRVMIDVGKQELMNEYLKWWRIRDIRTYIDAKFDFSTRSGFVPVADAGYWKQAFIAHDSTHDVAADILRLQTIHRAENDLEQLDR